MPVTDGDMGTLSVTGIRLLTYDRTGMVGNRHQKWCCGCMPEI